MRVLIVVSNSGLGLLWGAHLKRLGAEVAIATSQRDAVEILQEQEQKVIILDLDLTHGSSLAISDFASYRQPAAKVIFVTSKRFFTDGSIFNHSSNACAFVPSGTAPEDLALLAEHHANRDD